MEGPAGRHFLSEMFDMLPNLPVSAPLLFIPSAPERAAGHQRRVFQFEQGGAVFFTPTRQLHQPALARAGLWWCESHPQGRFYAVIDDFGDLVRVSP